jgi:hypothetical protein
MGRTPSTSQRFAELYAPMSRSGSPSPVSVRDVLLKMAMSSNVVFCVR